MAGKTKQSEPKMRLDLRAKMYIVLVICSLKIYRTEIPVSTRTAESASSTHSVLSYDASGPASIAYKTLAKEVVDNERVRQQHHTPLTR